MNSEKRRSPNHKRELRENSLVHNRDRDLNNGRFAA